MTPEEIQEIVDLVLQAIRTNSKTIEQLTEAFSVGNADYFELSGGRKISFATLAEFIETQGGLITTEQIADGAVTEAKTSFIKVVSDNLLNKADVLEGKLINSSNGALVNIQGIFTANYIPVKPSTDYWWLGTQTAYGYAFYDANKQLLTYGSKGTENDRNKPGHATSPEGAAYLRVSFPNGQIDTAQVNEGSWKTHDEYRFGIDDNLLPGDTMPIDGARIINNTVTPDKITFFVTNRSSINLYNPAAATNGKYIVATTGALADASTLCVSDYIPVKPGTEYFYYGRQRSYGYAFYDADKTRIAFGAKGTENDKNIGSKVAPAGAAYMRVTFLIADNGTNEVNEGIPYLSKIPAQLDTIMGQQGSFASAASLAADGELALGTFPVYISKQLCMVFGCKFSTFTSATLGQRNGYVTVDSQNVYVYGNLSTGGFGLRQTVAHNLTISNYIRLMLFVEGTKVTDITMNASLVVSTATGYTVIKLNSWYYTHGGEVYASVGQASTDASIGATCIDFRSPVWAFGDSYFGLSPARWPYVMRELGYFNYYFEGLGGGTSYDMYHEMERASVFGTPRYLLWCLGMNDQDPDNTTPSANWLAVFGHIKDYCSENGVQLILATIPNTPTRRNYAKNEVVKASGYRYIDFAKAVGAENAGSSWYTGMLHTDNVHPTELGAQALATQVLIDFPELMEICKTPAVGGGGGDPVDAYTKAEADARFVQPTYVDDKVNAVQGQMVFRDAYSQNIFTSDDVPAGNTISLKYVPLSSGSANVVVYDTSNTIIKRFELSSVVAGQEYTFDDYVLPDTYARVYVTNYQHLDVYVTVVGWSNKALFEAMGGKQDILTAGENITIENNVISASGGGGNTIRFCEMDCRLITIDRPFANMLLGVNECGGYLWIAESGSASCRVARYNLETGEIVVLRTPVSFYTGEKVCITQDADGNFWFAPPSVSARIYKVDKDFNVIKTASTHGWAGGVYAGGYLWTQGGGIIYMMDTDGNDIKTFQVGGSAGGFYSIQTIYGTDHIIFDGKFIYDPSTDEMYTSQSVVCLTPNKIGGVTNESWGVPKLVTAYDATTHTFTVVASNNATYSLGSIPPYGRINERCIPLNKTAREVAISFQYGYYVTTINYSMPFRFGASYYAKDGWLVWAEGDKIKLLNYLGEWL